MKFIITLLLLFNVMNGCIGISKMPIENKANNEKILGIRNWVFSSALLGFYSQTAVSQTTEFDFTTLESSVSADRYVFSPHELTQMNEAQGALEKQGLLTPEAKYKSVFDTAVLFTSPE